MAKVEVKCDWHCEIAVDGIPVDPDQLKEIANQVAAGIGEAIQAKIASGNDQPPGKG